MKTVTAFFLALLICLAAGQSCFAQSRWEESNNSGKLTNGDIRKALLAGEITSDCQMRDVKGHSALSLNPNTVIIKAVSQKDDVAKIYFMGRLKKSIHSDEMVMMCESDLIRQNNGEWMDPKTGKKLKK